MKTRIMIVITTLITLTLFVGFAWACPGCGYHSGQGWGSGYQGNQSPQYPDFMNETASLREELADKRGEYSALMAQDNPDPKRAGQLELEISRLQDQIQTKAQSHNMSCSYRARNHGANWNGHNNHGGWCW